MLIPELPAAELEQRGASWTAREIVQQPDVWREARESIVRRGEPVRQFLQQVLEKPDLRIILTGAGSSAYIGQCLLPALLEGMQRRVEAIATTDLIASPAQYFQRTVPTLLVSFARSGNSPESLAAVEIGSQQVDACFHLVVTCNKDGTLYARCNGRIDAAVWLLPDATHDRSFAMTSSFSTMLYAALCLFLPGATSSRTADRICAAGTRVIEHFSPQLRALAARRFARTVFLGSGALRGLANEAALKLLELTDGADVVMAESPLGFRHGPKTVVTRDTLVFVFVSNDPLTRRYDLDLARELKADGIVARLCLITADHRDCATFDALVLPEMELAEDYELLLPYVICAQLYAMFKALEQGRTPDSPSVAGTVSRVVQGVTIYHGPG
jgi:tagatose-6-phosphate ketose/aldose isomerase